MKRFIIAIGCIVGAIFLCTYLYYYVGVSFNPNKGTPEEAQVTFVQKEKTIYHLENGNLEPFEIKGVDLGASQPGNFATDYAISKETYLRWFKMIKDTGANCIRTYILLGTDFYEAFYEYNVDNPDPLYLVHGVWLNDYSNNSHLSAHDSDFIDVFKSDVRTAIDAVHGKRIVELGRVAGTGSYTKDISPWVIGYILGIEWEPPTVVYTDLIDDDKASYEGEYLQTTADASPFEAMLAEVGDEALSYETERYGDQRLIAFSNWPHTDANEFSSELVKAYLTKYATVDVEHIKATDAVKSGMFVSYHIYPYYPDFYRYVPEYAETKDPYGNVNTYYAYLKQLAEHHSLPVIISEFGVPTSRGRSAQDTNTNRHQGLMSEHEQALAIVQCYRDIKDSGCAGCILFIWQDEWFKRSWNTWPYIDTLKSPYWNNIQTPEQNYGVITFDPGTDRSVSYVDGDPEEWTQEDVLGENDGLTLSAKYDEKYLYFLVQGEAVNEDQAIYLPIDTTQKSGSSTVAGSDLSFDRDADFLIVIDGEENSHVLVQERYEVLRATSLSRIARIDPYIDPPAADTDVFKPIYLIVETAPVELEGVDSVADLEGMSLAELDATKKEYNDVYETGKLRYGNANPSSEDFDSLADFFYGDGLVEVRIPWELLNFSNPSEAQIHDDYYEKYGVENMTISSMWVGVGFGDTKIPFYELPLRQWGTKVTYHERTKESYDVLKSLWTGEKTATQILDEADAAGVGLDDSEPVEVVSYHDLYYPEEGTPPLEDPTEAILRKAAS